MESDIRHKYDLPLMLQIFRALETGEFLHAEQHCKELLDKDPENAYAHLAKLMSERKVGTEHDLVYQQTPLHESRSYKWILRFADDELKHRIETYNQCTINNKNGQSGDIPPSSPKEINSAYFAVIQGTHDSEKSQAVESMPKANSKLRIVIPAFAAIFIIAGLFSLLISSNNKADKAVAPIQQVSQSIEKDIVEKDERAPSASNLQNEIQNFERFYEKAEYARFNSPASVNGLGDTPVYLNATIDTDISFESGVGFSKITDEDNNSWALLFFEDKGNTYPQKGDIVKIYGIYLGISEKYDDLPSIAVARYVSENTLYNMVAMGIPVYIQCEQDLDYLSSTQTIGDYNYEVLSTWRVRKTDENNIYYYFSDDNTDGFLYVTRALMPNEGYISREDAYIILYGVEAGIKKGKDISDFSSEEIMVGEHYALKSQQKRVVEGVSCYITYIYFIDNTGVYTFSLVEPIEKKGVMLPIFEGIVDNIKSTNSEFVSDKSAEKEPTPKTLSDSSEFVEEEVLKQISVTPYELPQSFSGKRLGLVLKNNSAFNLHVVAKVIFKDETGKPIEIKETTFTGFEPGSEQLFRVYADSEFVTYDYELSASEDTFYKPILEHLSYETNIQKGKVIVSIKSAAEKPISSIRADVLFIKGDEAVDYGLAYGSDADGELKPGKTAYIQIDTMESFDSAKVFIGGFLR